MIITAVKSNPQKEIHYYNSIHPTVLLFQSAHYPWCKCLKFAETCAILQGFLSQEKLHQHSNYWEKKNQLGNGKSTANTSSFYFDLLHLVITISKGSDVQIFKYKLIYFRATHPNLLYPHVIRLLWCECAGFQCACMQTFHCGKVQTFRKWVLTSAGWHCCRKWL